LNLVTGNLGMRGFPPAEAHLDFDFVTLLEEAARGANANLQVVVIRPRPKPHLLDF
jgi:hypothetical protein